MLISWSILVPFHCYYYFQTRLRKPITSQTFNGCGYWSPGDKCLPDNTAARTRQLSIYSGTMLQIDRHIWIGGLKWILGINHRKGLQIKIGFGNTVCKMTANISWLKCQKDAPWKSIWMVRKRSIQNARTQKWNPEFFQHKYIIPISLILHVEKQTGI